MVQPKADTSIKFDSKVAGKGNFGTQRAYLKQLVIDKANKYGQDPKMMDKIISCESSYRTDVIHDGGNGKGITGFWKETFTRWEKTYERENGISLEYGKPEDQIELMMWAFSRGEANRDDWSSYNKLKRYGECNNKKLREMGIKKINIYAN